MSESLSDFAGSLDPKSITVNGVKLQLREFDMRTRGLWLDVAEEFGLQQLQHEIQTKVIPRISSITTEVESDPRLRSIEKRMSVLTEAQDKILALYGTDDEPADSDQQLEALAVRVDGLRDELRKLTDALQDNVFQQAKEAEKQVGDFMLLQDKARVNFVWRLARAMGNTGMEFDDFFETCSGDDYEAAERFVTEGNARWASLFSNRLTKTKPNR
jgi:hypothetical protein